MAIESYSKEGKSVIYVAIGCSGGKHRSVYIANELSELLRKDVSVRISHRDIQR
jgi:UPF0042 nucleotide-binding protein